MSSSRKTKSGRDAATRDERREAALYRRRYKRTSVLTYEMIP